MDRGKVKKVKTKKEEPKVNPNAKNPYQKAHNNKQKEKKSTKLGFTPKTFGTEKGKGRGGSTGGRGGHGGRGRGRGGGRGRGRGAGGGSNHKGKDYKPGGGGF